MTAIAIWRGVSARADLTPEDLAADPWAALAAELDRWAAAGRPATLWWRDDDAAEDTPALERLLALGAAAGVPLALAVVPGNRWRPPERRASPSEAVDVLQHGWRHANHAAGGEGGWELGDHRPLAEVAAELEAGRERLREAFGDRFLPVLVPPWNHISEPVVQALPGLGFSGLSTFGAAGTRHAGAGTGPGQRALRSDQLEERGALRRHRQGARRPDRASAGASQRRRRSAGADRPRHASSADGRGEPGSSSPLLLQRTAAWQSAREVFRRLSLPPGIEVRSAGADDRDAGLRAAARAHEQQDRPRALAPPVRLRLARTTSPTAACCCWPERRASRAISA